MNKWIGVGRLTKDPDYKRSEVNENSSFCRFSIAVDRPYVRDRGNQPSADFISCVCFGKSAEFVNKFFHKGDPIMVEGRIQTGSYEKNGQRVYTTDIMVEKTEFVPKSGNTDGGQSGQSNGKHGARDASERRRDDYRDIPDGVDEELPFS